MLELLHLKFFFQYIQSSKPIHEHSLITLFFFHLQHLFTKLLSHGHLQCSFAGSIYHALLLYK